MTKTDLQKELLEKIKPGTKPSDIKKGVKKPTLKGDLPPPITEKDEGYESDKSEKNIPTPPPPPTNLLTLQKQIELHKEIKKADEKKKQELQEKIKTLIKLAGEEKEEYKQNIKDLQTKINEQDKTIQDLKKTVKNQGEVKQQPIKTFNCYHCKKEQALPLLVLELPEGKLCQPCWTILRKKTKESVKPIKPTITNFTCHNCKEEKKEQEYKVKLDATLTEYSTCSTCLPLIKEYNEKEQDSERKLEEWE